MRAIGPSSSSMSNALRNSTAFVQNQLLKAQVESASGRHKDVGLVLGGSVARNIGWRGNIAANELAISTSKIELTKAELTQNGLEQIKSVANSFIGTLTGARTAVNGQNLAKQAAQSALETIGQVLNTTFDGQYIFSGVNSDSPGLSKYSGSSAQASVDAAYLSFFGFAPSSPAATGITPSQLQTFLQTTLKTEFSAPNWSANWSGASNQNKLHRLDDQSQVDISANANASSIRSIVESVVAVLSAAEGQLNASTFAKLADNAVAGAAGAVAGIGNEQARIGIAQEKLNRFVTYTNEKSVLLKQKVQESEGVDQYEAAMRMNQLLTQLETSFAVTSRISRLSLVNFI